MKIISFSRRERMALYVFVAAACVYVAVEVIYKSFRVRADGVDARVVAAEKKLRKANETMQMQKIAMKHSGDLGDVFLKRPPAEEMSSVLAELEAIASQGRVQISDMKPQPVRVQGREHIFSVRLALRHDLKTVLEFIAALQGGPSFFNVDEFSFERADAAGEGLLCIVVVSRSRLSP
ncbi:MAG TPA: hypothetical protein P5246_03445 [Candidatus Omnitrophota bacterium]|jgi:hypothetical protein|nr:hypothetical protein [Candidatus Omnitrophota bacterium]HSA30611.1 hypothetical protein [Candidatus Omnitrophota bacterium]